MIKNTVAAAIALFGITVLVALTPVSASTTGFSASTEYLPAQIENKAQNVQPAIYEFGDVGLAKSFPKLPAEDLSDAAPMMYN